MKMTKETDVYLLPVTVLILTKNEEMAINACLNSVRFFDQVIVIDSMSIDRTKEIVESNGVQAIDFVWNGEYPKKKQWALERSEIRNDWVLLLDADENVTSDLFAEFAEFFRNGDTEKFVAFEIPISYSFMGRFLRHGHKVKKISLLNIRRCRFPIVQDLHVSNMWEVEGHYQPICDGKLGKCSNFLSHLDPDPLYDYFARHNRYSDWESELRVNEILASSVKKARTKQGRIFVLIPFKPAVFFLYSYFLRSGWRDGRAGFNYAIALSFYYWQISVKAWERKGFA